MPMFGNTELLYIRGDSELCNGEEERDIERLGRRQGLSTETEVGTETQSLVDKESVGKESEVL